MIFISGLCGLSRKDQLGMESRKVVLLSTIYSCRRTHFTRVVKTISSGLSRPNASLERISIFDNWFLLPPRNVPHSTPTVIGRLVGSSSSKIRQACINAPCIS